MGRTTVGAGAGNSLTPRILGQTLGEETHTLTVDEMPTHSHPVSWDGVPIGQNVSTPTTGGFMPGGLYAPNTGYAAVNVLNSGGSQPHNNMQPSLVVNYIIKY
jgi:microcystin-dependent protein